MLTITRTAAEAIESVLGAEGGPGEAGGVRITQQHAEGEIGLALAIATEPQPEDQVVAEEGARVFLPPDTAALLDDKVLDARVEGTRVDFQLLERP